MGRGFPLGRSEALVGDGKGKVERLLAGEAQVSVPDALPTLARKGAMLLSATCWERGVAILLGLGLVSSTLPVPTAVKNLFHCLPISTRFHFSGLWERTWCSSWKNLVGSVGMTFVQYIVILGLVTSERK